MDKVCQANGNNRDKKIQFPTQQVRKRITKSTPPKQENNNEDKCRNNEVEVKKAEDQTNEPTFWFL